VSVSLAWWVTTAPKEPPLPSLAPQALIMIWTILRRNVKHALPASIARPGQVFHPNVPLAHILLVVHKLVLTVRWELIVLMKRQLRSKKMRIYVQQESIA
jgi:hypothetical protein